MRHLSLCFFLWISVTIFFSIFTPRRGVLLKYWKKYRRYPSPLVWGGDWMRLRRVTKICTFYGINPKNIRIWAIILAGMQQKNVAETLDDNMHVMQLSYTPRFHRRNLDVPVIIPNTMFTQYLQFGTQQTFTWNCRIISWLSSVRKNLVIYLPWYHNSNPSFTLLLI